MKHSPARTTDRAVARTPASSGRARARTAALAATGLLAPLTVLVAPTGHAVTGSGTVSVAYACTNTYTSDVAQLPLDLTVRATPAGTGTRLSVDGGRATLEQSLTLSKISGTLRGTAAGKPVQLTGGTSNLVITSGKPFTLPSLTGTVDAGGSSLVFTPGTFSMSLTASFFTLTLTCTVQGTAPGLRLGPAPTHGSGTPSTTPPTAAPKPSTPPTRAAKVRLTLSRAAVRTGGKRATAKVRVRRASTDRAQPSGTVKVKVGRKTVATRKVARGRTVTVRLPRRLAVGRQKVSATFVPDAASRSEGHRRATARATLKVRR